MTTKTNIDRVRAAAAKTRPNLTDKLVLAKEAGRIAKERAAATQGHLSKALHAIDSLQERLNAKQMTIDALCRTLGVTKESDLADKAYDTMRDAQKPARVWSAREAITAFLDVARMSRMTSAEIAAGVLAIVDTAMCGQNGSKPQ